MRLTTRVALLAALVSALALAAAAQATNFAAWGGAQKIDEIAGNNSELNTPFQDGCPIQSPDGLSLYIASTRPAASACWTSGSPAGTARAIRGERRRISVSRSTRPRTSSARPRFRAAASSS